MTHASLFSGIGGAELAASWMGWDNVFHCEIQEFPRKVLEYWFPNSISYEDITKTDFSEWRGKIVNSMTISYGCVRSLEEDWELVHDIEKEADRRMYASKARYYSDSGIDRRK